MKAKHLVILSVLVLLTASFTLGCTGSSPAPTPTTTQTVTDNQTIAPAGTPLPTDVPVNVTVPDDLDNFTDVNNSLDQVINDSNDSLPVDNNTSFDPGY